MRKKIIYILLAVVLLPALVFGWLIFGPGTAFPEKSRYIYVRSDAADFTHLVSAVADSGLVSSPGLFHWLARENGVDEKVHAGRFEVRKGTSLFQLVRMLKNNVQSPVKLVITKLRTREQLEGFLGRKMEADSAAFAAFLSSPDSLKSFGLDTANCMTAVFPDTYEYSWAASPGTVFRKLFAEKKKFWTPERIAQATALKLDPDAAYIIASIVEEETNALDEKDTIASVYINRLQKGMKLQADPTVKFALRDFTLKRIYEKHLLFKSPYNTYLVNGLPPGPICTPSRQTLEAVLKAPVTPYLYFVAKSDFSGRHVFSATYEEHLVKAKAFQDAQDEQQRIKKEREGAQ